MPSSALTPAQALRSLGDISSEVRAAIVLDADGSLAAADPDDGDLGERLRESALAVLETAEGADGERPAEIEAATAGGTVYLVRGGGRSLAVVAGRLALSSLMRYDLRRILADLEDGSR